MLGGMGSKREEERNEKIIRGLMKLPPNRKCINCNSLGPQYVCTNFWSFVCITCSGIHREFTHRVKSVSMSKFTSQEVQALQNGGNQRAREVYLKAWDFQSQRLPSSSNVDKIRKFIKDVYVDKRYAGEKVSEKHPNDMQGHLVGEDETRRASSYHSYSQSPPYDYQYEDRRYGKQAAMLMRKTGSDKGCYDGKMSSFLYSPGHNSELMYGDRSADEGSVVSDYSTSSAGDPFRSGTQSPRFRKDFGFGSPPFQPSRDVSNEDGRPKVLNTFTESTIKKDEDVLPHKQRSKSSGSYGSIDSKFMFAASIDSEGLAHTGTESEQTAKTMHFPRSYRQGSSCDSSDILKAAPVSATVSSGASSIDLFQSPVVASSSLTLGLFQPLAVSSTSSVDACKFSQTLAASSLDISTAAQSKSTVDVKSTEFSVSNDEGWATFDSPQPSASTGNGSVDPANMHSKNEGPLGKLNPFSPSGESIQWPSYENSSFHGPYSSTSSPWHDSLHDGVPATQSTPVWNAFEDSDQKQPLGGVQPDESGVLKTSGEDWVEKTACDGEPPISFMQSSVFIQPLFTALGLPQGEVQAHTSIHKSINPFDVSYDSNLEQSNMFPDMSSLQAALPDARVSSSFLGSVSQPWFAQCPPSTYIPVGDEGGLTYMAAQVPTSQIPNVAASGPVASFGGNPFA